MHWPSWPTSPWHVPGRALGTMIQHEVLLSVPNVEISPRKRRSKVAEPGNPDLVAECGRISAACTRTLRATLIFPEASGLELVRVVVGRQLALEDIVDLEDEALAETGDIILKAGWRQSPIS